MNAPITRERLMKLFVYDEASGEFRRRVASGTAKAGDVAGWIEPSGYRKLSLDGRKYYAHRCVFLYVDGAWPEHVVDHIDGNRLNNRRANLRDVAHAVNLQNLKTARRDNATGHLGVCWNRGAGKFMAEIKSADGVRHYLGLFSTKEEASDAYLAAKRAMHAGCTL